MSEFVNKRKGFARLQLHDWHRSRFVAYYAAAPYLKKGTKITDFLSLPGEKKSSSELKNLKGEDFKKWYEDRKELERKAGIRVDNEE